MSLTQQELAQFHRLGFLLKPGLFGVDDLEPLRNALTEIIDQQARVLLADGQLTQLYEEEPFCMRLARIHAESKEAGGQITQQIMGKGGGGYNGPAMLHCIRHAPLLSCIESLVGPDIVGSSVYRIRPKLPGWGRGEVPWHQDAGYTLAHCDRHLIVTCWGPLVDATLENGCLHAIPSPWPAIRPKPISSFGTGTIQREKSALPRSSKRCGNGMRAAAPLHRDGAGRRCGSGNVQPH